MRACAAKWLWRDDAKRWKPFTAAVSQALEHAYSCDRPDDDRLPVDDERHVDVSLDAEGIQAEFVDASLKKMKNKEELVGIQRRNDDHSKRRPVRRVAPEIFGDDTIVCTLGTDSESCDEVRSIVEAYGGLGTSRVNKSTTHVVIMSQDEAAVKNGTAFAKEVKAAARSKIPVLKEGWIDACIETVGLATTAPFVLDIDPSGGMPSAPPTTAQKRKAGKEVEPVVAEDTGGPPAPKKSKVEAGAASPAAQSAGVPATPLGAKITTTVGTPASSRIQHFDGSEHDVYVWAPFVRGGTQWTGQCTSVEDGSAYPMLLTIEERGTGASAHTFRGEVNWISLKSRTRCRGELAMQDDGSVKVEWEEFELIEGDDVEVPLKYAGVVVPGSPGTEPKFEGSVVTDEEDLASDVTLHRLSVRAARNWDKVIPAKTTAAGAAPTTDAPVILNGVCYQAFPFRMELTERKGSSVSGVMNWLGELDGAQTRVRGSLEGNTFFFEESEALTEQAQELVLPSHYRGSLADGQNPSEVSGAFASFSGETSGAFVLRRP